MFYLFLPEHSAWFLNAGKVFLIGRDPQCDLQLEDRSASRVHCRLLARDGRVFLTDAGSRWGTFVNGKRIQQAELTVGDEITIGETQLSLELGARSLNPIELYRTDRDPTTDH